MMLHFLNFILSWTLYCPKPTCFALPFLSTKLNLKSNLKEMGGEFVDQVMENSD